MYPFSSLTNRGPDTYRRSLNFETNKVNVNPPPSTPVVVRPAPKVPSSPPLQRQNSKTTPPSPPEVIRDVNRSLAYTRVGFLGEGGFARVYEVKDSRGARSAIKVVTKSSLKTKKAKTKLYAEIKIHRSLDHPNIVNFGECFEDQENVYMTLELCESGSLMDMLRRRKRFTEPEARYFMVQLIGACHYMHMHQVIHRDLKLGNLFLDRNMTIKVGDFGLAALIENPGERKKTICGTPNYIAPEVLFDTANGHSFEVDTWSNGVILYTLLIGKPPFQTKEVKAIYKRIRDNEYEFPIEREIGRDAKELISSILTPDPRDRPSLAAILEHAFFTNGIVPAHLPISAQDIAPDFRHISRPVSQANLARLRRQCLLDDDQTTAASIAISVAGSSRLRGSASSTLAQQEKEFQKAIQPGSPISALLSSARQPLLVSTNNPSRETPLIRKLAAVAPPSRPSPSRNPLANIEEESDAENEAAAKAGARETRELESQKARIVAQMVPSRQATFPLDEELENDPPEGETKPPRVRDVKPKPNLQPLVPPTKSLPAVPTTLPSLPTADDEKASTFDTVARTLALALDAKGAGKLFREPARDAYLPRVKVFIVSWVDYCNKYGMGYALTDGSVGVHFNDSTTMIMSADKEHIDYVSSKKQGAVYVRKPHSLSDHPEELKSKVYLLKHFEKYMMDRLYGEYDYTYQDLDRSHGMDFVQKYLRMKHVIVFRMSHDVLQFNFYDHSKLIISSQGHVITHIDKHYNLTHWTLSEIMARALDPGLAKDVAEQKFNHKLVDKLTYCREVLQSIRQAGSTNGLPSDGKEPAPSAIAIGAARAGLRD